MPFTASHIYRRDMLRISSWLGRRMHATKGLTRHAKDRMREIARRGSAESHLHVSSVAEKK